MKLLVDNNLPAVLGRGLAALFAGQHRVEHIKDRFGTGSLPDEEWIEALGKEGGWSVPSGDIRIAKKRPSRELFLRANLTGFFPLPAVMAMPLHRQAARVLVVWPTMVSIASTVGRGCFEVGIKSQQLAQIA